MDEKPRRRWFRFSLRTLFLLVTLAAVSAGWVSWSLNWIRQRQSALRTDGIQGNPNSLHTIYDKPQTPSGLWIFGEVGQSTLIVQGGLISKDRSFELRELFPEAELWIRDGSRKIKLRPLQ
jgi:hypothetical protein